MHYIHATIVWIRRLLAHVGPRRFYHHGESANSQILSRYMSTRSVPAAPDEEDDEGSELEEEDTEEDTEEDVRENSEDYDME
jgi:hypothetical protein